MRLFGSDAWLLHYMNIPGLFQHSRSYELVFCLQLMELCPLVQQLLVIESNCRIYYSKVGEIAAFTSNKQTQIRTLIYIIQKA